MSIVALPEGGMGEAAVQVGVDVSAALLHGPRVRQHHEHRRRPFLIIIILLHNVLCFEQLFHQVHSRQLIAMGTTAHSDPGQPWQMHHFVYLHLTEGRQRYSGEKCGRMQQHITVYACTDWVAHTTLSVFLFSAKPQFHSVGGISCYPQCWCHWVHCRQHCNTKRRQWFMKPYLVFLACWKL